ncbi:MAG TPA: protein kinase [Thermoanaerobaculia bacterium]|nr:protein kinase [Thermoanaerobaculia bacterium]
MSSREPGTVLDGKYEIVQRLASGGMGEVCLVRHIHLQELRVVKILRQDLAADPVAQKRFVREARLATQIKHPNVAILYDFSRLPDGSFYMVWEHIQGRDVGDFIRQDGPFPVVAAIRLGIQALRGLAAIHASGIIHRDLSPDNLMIMEDGRQQRWLKIIDLGLAKNLKADSSAEITQVGMFMGKLQYCSPEQAGAADGETLDRRSDLYSFALVFYEMITGLPPFESENQHGFIFKRLSEDPLPMVGRNPKVQVPAELDRVIRQALERDREKRLPDAISFIVALEKVEKGLAKVETREVVPPPEVRAGERAAPRPPEPARQRSSSELSREERLDLLAQIERAAKRVSESSLDLARVEGALAAGRVDEARRLVAQIDAANPRAPGLDRIRERLAQAVPRDPAALHKVPAPHPPAEPPVKARKTQASPATPAPQAPQAGMKEAASALAKAENAVGAGRFDEAQQLLARLEAVHPQAAGLGRVKEALARAREASADLRRRVAEAEEVLDKYIKRKQLPLARLALETLLELAPRHPNRADYESWVKLLAEEVERDKRSEVALAAGRAALGRRDFKAARRELEQVKRSDMTGKRAEQLAAELEGAERDLRQGAEFEDHRRRLGELLAGGRLAEAETEIEQLAALGVSKITLDSFRERLDEARAAAEQQGIIAPLEKRYRESLQARDWFGAREVAIELEGTAPASSRAAAMFGEVERLESIHHRQQSVEQAVRQIDDFIGKGQLEPAELAFRILLQMDPENRHRKRLERQLKGIEKSGRV